MKRSKEHPILFSPILAAANRANINPDFIQQKTQTRRLSGLQHMNKFPQEAKYVGRYVNDLGQLVAQFDLTALTEAQFEFILPSQDKPTCPYGAPFELLWVKERHYVYGRWLKLNEKTKTGNDKIKFYPLDGYPVRFDNDPPTDLVEGQPINKLGWYSRISLHMPKEYAQQWLIIEDVTVERLASITKEDAIAEGVQGLDDMPFSDATCYRDYSQYPNPDGYGHPDCDFPTFWNDPTKSFKTLIEKINGPNIWTYNPWVWVIKYRTLSFDGRPSEHTVKAANQELLESLKPQS